MTAMIAAGLAASLFPGVADPGLPAHIEALLALAHWRRLAPAGGALHQALLLVVSDPRAGRARAALRLQLRDGRIHALTVAGPLAELLDFIVPLASHLAATDADERTADERELALARLAGGLGLGGAPALKVTLDRGGALLPAPFVSRGMLNAMVLDGLNRLRARYRPGPEQPALPALAALPPEAAAALADAVSPRHAEVGAFLDGLDGAALAYLEREAPRDALAVYNFLAGQGGAHCRNRLQAVRVLPCLLTALTVSPSLERDWSASPDATLWRAWSTRIGQGIDRGEPLFDVVAEALRVPRETVRWLARRPLPANWRMDMRRLELLLRLLSWLPPEQRPDDASRFLALVDFGNALLAPFRGLARPLAPVDIRDPRYGVCLRRWLGELTRQRRLHLDDGGHGYARLRRELEDSRDFLRALYGAARRHGDMDADAGTDPVRHLVLAWAAGTSLRGLLRHSEAWHALAAQAQHDYDEQEDREHQDGQAGPDRRDGWEGRPGGVCEPGMSGQACGHASSRGWPLVLEQPWRPPAGQGEGEGAERIVIVELGTPAALREEAARMRHCIGGYAESCRGGDSLVFALRGMSEDGDGHGYDLGGPLSTVELHLHGGAPHGAPALRVTAGQHRGASNAAPSAACARAVAALVAHLNGARQAGLLLRRHVFQREQGSRLWRRQQRVSADEQRREWQRQDWAWTLAMGRAPAAV